MKDFESDTAEFTWLTDNLSDWLLFLFVELLLHNRLIN